MASSIKYSKAQFDHHKSLDDPPSPRKRYEEQATCYAVRACGGKTVSDPRKRSWFKHHKEGGGASLKPGNVKKKKSRFLIEFGETIRTEIYMKGKKADAAGHRDERGLGEKKSGSMYSFHEVDPREKHKMTLQAGELV